MGHREFSLIEDFVFDPSFRNWVLNNKREDKLYWQNWMTENPDKVKLANYAKAIVYALSVNQQQLSESELEAEIKDILNKARKLEEEKTQAVITPISSRSSAVKRLTFWPAAAAIFIVIVFLAALFTYNRQVDEKTQATLYELPSLSQTSQLTERYNNSDTIQSILLADGSRVGLSPKSKLSFSKNLSSGKREVYLTGEAFFDVRKNPSQPFFVYTRSMVTKVLGTSFIVKAYTNDKKASVQVRTGKVSVYKKENFSEKNTVANKLDGLIVTPNQQVVYDLERNQLSKTIIDKPVMLTATQDERFVFNATPLKEVFRVLQNAYGITIMYDESVISSCSLSVAMGDETFYEKLEMICKAIGASYESIDGTIFIAAHGCN